MRALPISRSARHRFRLDSLANGPGPAAAPGRARLATDIAEARRVAAAVNATRRPGEPGAQAGELAALDLLHEVFHLLITKAGELEPAASMPAATGAVETALSEPVVKGLLGAVADEFPEVAGETPPGRLEELLLLRIANENPAVRPLRDLVDDSPLPAAPRDGASSRSRPTTPGWRRSAPTARRSSSCCARPREPIPPRSPASCATSGSAGMTCWAMRSIPSWTGCC